MQLLWVSLFLSVQISGISGGPFILQNPATVLAEINKQAKLHCEIKTSSDIKTLYWFRRVSSPNNSNHYQFLVQLEHSGSAKFGDGISSNFALVSRDRDSSTLTLLGVKSSDSGIYNCALISSPQLTFGRGIQLIVVDALPTSPPPTKKTTPKRKGCKNSPSVVPKQNGPFCSIFPLSLLLGCILVLLISLIVTVRIYHLRNKARLRFVKQLQR